eukprot:2765216-Rhodomonas_salina.1
MHTDVQRTCTLMCTLMNTDVRAHEQDAESDSKDRGEKISELERGRRETQANERKNQNKTKKIEKIKTKQNQRATWFAEGVAADRAELAGNADARAAPGTRPRDL